MEHGDDSEDRMIIGYDENIMIYHSADEKETSDMEATNSFWKDQWSKWFNAQTEEIQQSLSLIHI